MASVRVSHFLPSTNAFHFDNNWPSYPDYTISVPGGGLGVGDASNGLCGGMVYTVIDLFEANLYPPPNMPRPAAGSPAFNYIVARLTNSFDEDDVNQYLSWIQMTDGDTALGSGLAWHEINEEWPKIKADLDNSTLSPLGLIHGQEPPTIGVITGVGDLGKCHQMLAWGYDLNGSSLTLHTYDPDYPGDAQTITLDVSNPGNSTPISVSDWASGYFRGFFRTHYVFHDPSTAVSGAFGATVVSSPGFPNGGQIVPTPPKATVPKLIGESPSEAASAAASAGFRMSVSRTVRSQGVDVPVVKGQVPAPGSAISRGSTISVEVAEPALGR